MKTCSKCVMDDKNDSDFIVDEAGVCNYCRSFAENPAAYRKYADGMSQWVNQIAPEIRRCGKGKDFDAVIGVSGGIDSSYLTYTMSKFHFRCFLAHADNDFDTNIAKRNLELISKKSGFPLKKYSVDADEYRSVQLAYFRAGVIDLDVPADYLDEASVRKAAVDNNVQYILSGGNYFSDAIMPVSWTYVRKNDWTNLRNINRKFGYKKLKSFPLNGVLQGIYNRRIRKMRYVTPLNYIGYHRFEACQDSSE